MRSGSTWLVVLCTLTALLAVCTCTHAEKLEQKSGQERFIRDVMRRSAAYHRSNFRRHEMLEGEPCYPQPCFADSRVPEFPERIPHHHHHRHHQRSHPHTHSMVHHTHIKHVPVPVPTPVQQVVAAPAAAAPRPRIRTRTRTITKVVEKPVVKIVEKKTPMVIHVPMQVRAESPVLDKSGVLVKMPHPPVDPGKKDACDSAVVDKDRNDLAVVNGQITHRRAALEAQEHWLLDANRALEMLRKEINMTTVMKDNIKTDVDDLLKAKQKLQNKLRADEIRAALDQARRTMSDMKSNKDILLEHKQEIETRARIAQKEFDEFQKQLSKFPPNEITREKLDQWPPEKPSDFKPVT